MFLDAHCSTDFFSNLLDDIDLRDMIRPIAFDRDNSVELKNMTIRKSPEALLEDVRCHQAAFLAIEGDAAGARERISSLDWRNRMDCWQPARNFASFARLPSVHAIDRMAFAQAVKQLTDLESRGVTRGIPTFIWAMLVAR